LFDKLRRRMFPITLSKALDIVVDITRRSRKRPHWFDAPVGSLIECIGDKPIVEVTTDDVLHWYDWIRQKENDRKPGELLSPWTIDSYGRAVRAFFNHLVRAGHLEVSPARLMVLPRLPPKKKKDISDPELARMVQHSENNPRDHAIVLILRDSGCRVGELHSMTLEHIKFSEHEGQLRGRAIIYDDKTHTSRWIYFGDQACQALKRYIRVRHHHAGDELWLTRSGTPLSKSGIYQALERVGERAGVSNFNPHAFRHALAKRLVNEGAPHKVLQAILGHSDIKTTLNMYVVYDDDELDDLHAKYGYD
jgi:site-specific recombinase XerD